MENQQTPKNPIDSTKNPPEDEEPQTIADDLNKPTEANSQPDAYLGKEGPKLVNLWDKLKWVVFGGATFLAIIFSFVYIAQPFKVDGESMTPTLQTGETLLVSKFPKTWASLTRSQYVPARGRIVIVKSKGALGEENYVKRVVALPGERVVIKNGKITVYNQNNPDGFNPDDKDCCRELEETSGQIDAVVPEGHIFVVGDNRVIGGSIDSRSGLGAIPASEVTGQTLMRIWPLSQFRTL